MASDSPLGNHLRNSFVKYNNSLAIGSMSYDREITANNHPYVKVHGTLHALLAGSSLPLNNNSIPLFHQLYKYDVNEATAFRMKNPVTGNTIMPNLIRNLTMILEEENYLVKQYKTARDLQADMMAKGMEMKNVFVVLLSPQEVKYDGPEHPGTLNLSTQDVQSAIYSMDENGAPPKNSLYIKNREFGGKLEVIGFYNPLIDPVSYPLLFFYGDPGYYREKYELKKDYRKVEDEEQAAHDAFDSKFRPLYPFECLGDELKKDVKAVDYESARKRYKTLLKAKGEEVSDSEDECEEDENEKDGITAPKDRSSDIDKDDDEMEVHVLDDEDPLMNVPGIRLLQPTDEEDNVDEQPDVVSDNVQQGGDEHEEWMRREDEKLQQVMEREANYYVKFFKLQKFKALCLRNRYNKDFLGPIFEDAAELNALEIDLGFIERTKRNKSAHQYRMAKMLWGMKMWVVDICYPHDDDDHTMLQWDIDTEISCLIEKPEYRKGEPDIDYFRAHFLKPAQHNDNMERQPEEELELVQNEISKDWKKNQKKRRKERKPVKCSTGPRKYVSRRQHALHQMQIRDPTFHPYLSTLLLGQLYVIDLVLRIIRQRNDNNRDHLIKIRGTHEKDLIFQRHNRSAQRKGFSLGYAFHLPSDRVSSAAWYKAQFEAAMTVMDQCGKPDLFITMTGNPAWKEITENLLPFSNWQSNPFLVNDVFYLKQQELLYDIVHRELFGPVVAWCYSIEFQKRGMPHMHLLVTLQDGFKLKTSDQIDKYISARIPPIPDPSDPHYERKMRGRQNVIDHMMHTACIGNQSAYCHARSGSTPNPFHNRCTKNFPVAFNTHTSVNDGGKVDYFRPADGVTCEKIVNKKKVLADNRYVVPHSSFLLNKYCCHINVEVVTSVEVVKYIYKYIYKGFDKTLAQFIESFEVDDGAAGRAPRVVVHAKKKGGVGVMTPYGLKGTQRQMATLAMRTEQEMRSRGILAQPGEKLTAYDEAHMVETFRMMTSSEAAWTIQANPISSISHNVISLYVHNEGEMPIFFRQGEEEKMLEKVERGVYQSQFVGWMKLNQVDENARKYTYAEIPLHYRWLKGDPKTKDPTYKWVKYTRDKSERNLVRVRPVSPRFLEAFSIRLLAMNQKGCRSYEELRTVDGIIYGTAHEAAKAMGLIDSQMEFDLCLEEAIRYFFPNRLRSLFATMLVFGGVKDPMTLWNKYHEYFIERRFIPRDLKTGINAALFHIEHILEEHHLTLETFGLPKRDLLVPLSTSVQSEHIDGVVVDSDPVDMQAEAAEMVKMLNEDQAKAYRVIERAVNLNGTGGNCFFLQGSGGCGKTFLYRALYKSLMSRDVPVCMIATTGIAATLLIKGTTAHRKFMLPLNGGPGSRSSMSAESAPAQQIKETTVFIIDESTMASRFSFEAIDYLMKDITGKRDLPFGGKIMLLGGDWKQLLPVVPGCSSNESLVHTLKRDPLWRHFKVLTLSKNERAKHDPAYSRLLENVGNGMVNGITDNNVLLDPKCIVKKADDIIDYIYSDMSIEPKELSKSCILCSLNSETHEINQLVLEKLDGPAKTYTSIDSPKDGRGMQTPPEFYRNDMPSGMPPYEITLKVGAIVILLRNLNVSRGLCNGTRLKVVRMLSHSIECELLTTDFAGDVVPLCKISLEPASTPKKPANFSRLQLPIRLAYAMTINKSQGQTFDRVGIILRHNVFSHGQLYVALSRAKLSDNVRVFSAMRSIVDGRLVVMVRNKVEQDILEPVVAGSLEDPDYEAPDLVDAFVEEETYKAPRCKPYIVDNSRPQSTRYKDLQKLGTRK